MPSIHAGFACSDITPPPGYKRSQWGGQSLVATRVIRPLLAKAAVFASRDHVVAIVSADICLICHDITRRVSEMLAAVIPSRKISVAINTSHSHQAAFLGPPGEQPGDPTYAFGYDQILVERMGSAIARAYRALEPATISVAQKQTQGLNRNRRRKDQPIDRTLSLVEVKNAKGETYGALWHFAAHPLSAMNTRAAWDPDFPGVSNDVMERLHPNVQFQYLQGAAGDVFPLDWYLHQDPPSMPTSLETADFLGHRLADELQTLMGHGERVSDDGVVRSVDCTIELPTRTPCWTVAEAEAAVKKYGDRLDHSRYEEWKPNDHVNTIAQTYEDRYRWVCGQFAVKIARDVGKKMTCRLSAHRVGKLVLPTIPGELFSESGMQLRDHRSGTKTLVLPYSNDNLLYLPPTHDLDEVQNWPLEEFLEQKKNRWAYGSTATALIGQGGAEAIVAEQKKIIDALF